jgi:hypothetical protein
VQLVAAGVAFRPEASLRRKLDEARGPAALPEITQRILVFGVEKAESIDDIVACAALQLVLAKAAVQCVRAVATFESSLPPPP